MAVPPWEASGQSGGAAVMDPSQAVQFDSSGNQVQQSQQQPSYQAPVSTPPWQNSSAPTSSDSVKTPPWEAPDQVQSQDQGPVGKIDYQGFQPPTNAGNDVQDAALAGTNYLISKAAQGGSIPANIFNDAALSIGKAVGWCGVYASSISTASQVGDSWAQKIATANKTPDAKNNIQPGFKIVLPLGVTNGQGFGHVITDITLPDAKGNFYAAQSNADGRQNRGQGLGVATIGLFNINDLNKQYGANWGAIPGQLKVNALANSSATPPGAPATTPPKITETPSTPIQTPQQSSNWLQNLASGVAGAAKTAVVPVLQQVAENQKESAATKPPSFVDVSNAKGLADYVMQNNIQDLQNKSWWQSSPVKGAAWDLISEAQGRGDTGKRFSVDQNEQLSQGSQSDYEAQNSLVAPNVNPALEGNPLMKMVNSALGTTIQKIGEVGAAVSNFGKSQTQPGNPVTNIVGFNGQLSSALISGVGDSMQQFAHALDGIRTGNAPSTIMNSLGATPAGAAFNTVMNMPVVGNVAKTALGAYTGATTWMVNNTPVVKDLPPEMKSYLTMALQIGGLGILHAAGKGIIEAVPDKVTAYTPEEVLQSQKDITSGVDSGRFSVQVQAQVQLTNFYKEAGTALQDIITGKESPGVSTETRSAVENMVKTSAQAPEQIDVLKNARQNGITITQAQGFVSWFNSFFQGAPEQAMTADMSHLLTDGKAAEAGTISPIDFTKEAADVLNKGESATLRDQVASPAVNPASPEALVPNENGVTPLESQSAQRTLLNNYQTNGAQSVVNVTANGQPALDIKTYTASDGKIAVSATVNTDAGQQIIPMNGAYADPRQAVAAVVPQVQAAIGSGSDVASTQIRKELQTLQDTKFSSVPPQGQITAQESTYVAPKEPINTKGMSRESIQAEIDGRVKEYVANKLKPAGVEGTPTELRRTAIGQLLNGVQDERIGHIPADTHFQQLMAELPIAKPEISSQGALNPIEGTGETAVHRGSLNIESKAVAEGLAGDFGNLPEFKRVNFQEEATKITDMIAKDPEKMYQIALGHAEAPKGVIPELVAKVYADMALRANDVNKLYELANSPLATTQAQALATRLAARGYGETINPVEAFTEIIRAREQAAKVSLAKEQLTTEQKAALKEVTGGTKSAVRNAMKVEKVQARDSSGIDTAIKQVRAQPKTVAEFLQALKCA